MSMKQVIIALIVSLFPAMMLAVPVQAEAISSQSEQPVEVEERWNLATKNMLEKKYAEAIPVFEEHVKKGSEYSFHAKMNLGSIFLDKGHKAKSGSQDRKKYFRQAYFWYQDAFSDSLNIEVPDEYKSLLDEGLVQHNLGYLCDLGLGDDNFAMKNKNEHCAFHWYRLAAEKMSQLRKLGWA